MDYHDNQQEEHHRQPSDGTQSSIEYGVPILLVHDLKNRNEGPEEVVGVRPWYAIPSEYNFIFPAENSMPMSGKTKTTKNSIPMSRKTKIEGSAREDKRGREGARRGRPRAGPPWASWLRRQRVVGWTRRR